MKLQEHLSEKLRSIVKAGWYRQTIPNRPKDPVIRVIDGRDVLQFCNNDYLGLSHDERVIQAVCSAAKQFGVGSTGSRLISGTTELHELLEKRLAQFKNASAALLFSSGYMTNLGTISALMGAQDLILSDQYNHSSMLSGAVLSKAEIIEFQHSNIIQLKELLEANRSKYKNCMIITESVFSMDGDLSELASLKELAEKFDAWLLCDEAHASGIFGDKGQGLAHELCRTTEDMPIRIGTCSKALGLEGGFVVGSHQLIEFLKNRSRTFIYSTALSPSLVAGLLKSLELLQEEGWRREKLWANVQSLHLFCQENELPVISTSSQIVCVKMPDNQTALACAAELLRAGIWVQAIRPPTVPTPRLRITLSCSHKPEHLEKLFLGLKKIIPFIRRKQ